MKNEPGTSSKTEHFDIASPKMDADSIVGVRSNIEPGIEAATRSLATREEADKDAKIKWQSIEGPMLALARSVAGITMCGDATVGSKEVLKHPGPIIPREQITNKEKEWNDIGSGTFARTFVQAERLLTTTRGGPPLCDIHRRTIWS